MGACRAEMLGGACSAEMPAVRELREMNLPHLGRQCVEGAAEVRIPELNM